MSFSQNTPKTYCFLLIFQSEVQKHKVFDDFAELDPQKHKVFDEFAEPDLQKHKVFDNFLIACWKQAVQLRSFNFSSSEISNAFLWNLMSTIWQFKTVWNLYSKTIEIW